MIVVPALLTLFLLAGGDDDAARDRAAQNQPAAATETGVSERFPFLERLPEALIDLLEDDARKSITNVRQRLEKALADAAVGAAELARGYGELGKLYHAYQIHRAAAACYLNAERLQPEDSRWPYFQGLLAFDSGQLAEAAERFSRVLELRPRELPAVLRVAEARLNLGDPAAAKAAYEQAIALDADSAAAHYGLGKVASEEKDYEEAARRFERALELQPGADAVHYSLALAYRNLGRLEEAREQAAQYGSVAPTFREPLADELRQAADSSHFAVVFADQHLISGRWELAEEGFLKALESDPENPKVHRGLGLVAEHKGDLEAAKKSFREAKRLEPGSPFYDFYLARIFSREKADREAIEHLEEVIRVDPGFETAYFRLATIHERYQRYEKALELYGGILELDPQNWAALVNRLAPLRRLGRLEEAEREAERLLKLNPRDAAVRVARALVLKDQGRADSAEEELRAALELEGEPPVIALAHYNLGVVRAERGDGADALGHYRQAVELDPGLVAARFHVGVGLARAGLMDEAADRFAEVVIQEPDHVPARLALATAAVLMGDFVRSQRVLEEGLELAPEEVGLAHTLALLLAVCPDPEIRDGDRALDLAQRVFQQAPSLEHGETLAMSYAEAGSFEGAVEWQTRVLEEVRRRGGQSGVEERLEMNLDRYRQGLPAHPPWTPEEGG